MIFRRDDDEADAVEATAPAAGSHEPETEGSGDGGQR